VLLDIQDYHILLSAMLETLQDIGAIQTKQLQVLDYLKYLDALCYPGK
jgi:hypothetical protein